MANGTELGKVAKQYMDRGDLVPGDIVIEMARDRMVGRARQVRARRLPADPGPGRGRLPGGGRGSRSDLTLYFEIEEEELLARLAGRAREEHRSDDTEVWSATAWRCSPPRPGRWSTTSAARILVRINAVGAIDAISEQIFATLH